MSGGLLGSHEPRTAENLCRGCRHSRWTGLPTEGTGRNKNDEFSGAVLTQIKRQRGFAHGGQLMTRVICVKEWTRLQHYKDRNPPWVKLYRDLLTSESWVLGTDLSRLVQVASVLLAARYGNQIPYRWDLLRKVSSLECSEKAFNEAVRHLTEHKFLEIQDAPDEQQAVEQVASTPLSECLLRGEKRREETEERQTRPREPACASVMLAEGLDGEAWKRWEAYRHEIRRPLKPASIPAAQRALAAYGADQSAVVEQSIAQGWQGLFALKRVGINGSHKKPAWVPPKSIEELEAEERARAQR